MGYVESYQIGESKSNIFRSNIFNIPVKKLFLKEFNLKQVHSNRLKHHGFGMFFNFLALQISSLNALAKSKVELGKALIRAAEKANKGDDKAKEADSKGVETGKKRKKPAS